MCFFPFPNLNFSSSAYKKGLHEFKCGACPECSRDRANSWALRCFYEAQDHVFNCMITLTYDSFVSLSDRSLGELPPDPSLHVSRRDIQLFLKRLRKWHSSISSERIKVFGSAEYGSRTHRAHYHLILFGVRFPDLVRYKKSKRGNIIYSSHILESLWSHGICTVDSININSSIARYCSKYCAKDRSSDTFLIASQKIGLNGLMRDFNGLNYIVEGREYTVPRIVWQEYIVSKYQNRYLHLKNAPLLSPRYINAVWNSDSDRQYLLNEFDFYRNKAQRAFYRRTRDKDPLYKKYLSYWSKKSDLYSSIRPSVIRRIYSLSDKFLHYKSAALRCLFDRFNGIPDTPPGSGCISQLEHFRHKFRITSLSRPYPCLNRASDTAPVFSKPYVIKNTNFYSRRRFVLPQIFDSPPDFLNNSVQLSFF